VNLFESLKRRVNLCLEPNEGISGISLVNF
jgi:hypothetical protein